MMDGSLRAGLRKLEVGQRTMSTWRSRPSVEPDLLYKRPVLVSMVLVIVVMLVFSLLADPKSGQLRPAYLAWLTLAAFPFAIGAVFYGELLLRKRWRRRQRREKRMTPRRRRAPEGSMSVKC
jgi:hypothetical protein